MNGLETIIKLISKRTIEDITTTHTRYYNSSDGIITTSNFTDNVINHWSIKNNLHWHLDIMYNGDSNRSRIKQTSCQIEYNKKSSTS